MHATGSAITGISVSPCGVGKTGSIRRAVTRTARLLPGRLKRTYIPGPPATLKTFGQFRVHVLYKLPEIPANTVIPEFAVSVTYRKHEKAENTSSILVSATNYFVIKDLQNQSYSIGRCGLAMSRGAGLDSKSDSLIKECHHCRPRTEWAWIENSGTVYNIRSFLSM
jgi:hypothetical protein